ncbi:MAG: HAD family phosphatase [Coleofasciculaceae cyanobacterium]
MLSAIFFDLDGTLVNTDPLHFQIWREMLRDYQLEIDDVFYKNNISGRANQLIIEDILPSLSLDASEKFAEEKEARFRELAKLSQPLAGLSNILDWTNKVGLKKAVVTNAPPKNAHFMLSVLGLTDSFDTVVLATDAVAAKPDPAPYLLALQRLGLNPEEVVTFEDSPSGIRSSVAAGIPTIGIASTHAPSHLLSFGAVAVFPDFTDEELRVWIGSY